MLDSTDEKTDKSIIERLTIQKNQALAKQKALLKEILEIRDEVEDKNTGDHNHTRHMQGTMSTML
jgi:hypothetical protein